jgi:hypothetical protein
MRPDLRLAACAVSAVLLGVASALAEPSGIGHAAVTKSLVEGILDGQAQQINAGSEVFSNELVRTGDQGLVRIVLLDSTDLAVGPKSEIKLDKFVYDPNGGSGSVVVNVSRGAFRFVTGTQDHRNYSIVTTFGTLGVRGTVFEVTVTSDRMDVHLVSGEVVVSSATNSAINQSVVLTPTANSASVSATGHVSAFSVPSNVTILSFSTAALGAAGSAGNRGTTTALGAAGSAGNRGTTSAAQLGAAGGAGAGVQLGAAGAAAAAGGPVLGSPGFAPAPNPAASNDLSNLVSE